MNKPGSYAALIAAHPRLTQFFTLIPNGDYTMQELYDFNLFAEPADDIEATHNAMVAVPDDGVGLAVEIVQLHEMYKASLIVKAQVQLLVRLEETGASFGLL